MVDQAIHQEGLGQQSKTIRLRPHGGPGDSIRKTSAELAERLGRDPTDDELAAEMNLPVSRITLLKSVSRKPASLDSPLSDDDGSTLGEVVPDEKAANPYERLQSKSLVGGVNRVLAQLEPREADIIRLRFGLEGLEPLTLEEVGEKIGVTENGFVNFRNKPCDNFAKTCLPWRNKGRRKKLGKNNDYRTFQILKGILEQANLAEETSLPQPKDQLG